MQTLDTTYKHRVMEREKVLKIVAGTNGNSLVRVKYSDLYVSEYGYAYKSCNTEPEWAEKANYSECLGLISDIPHYEVSILQLPLHYIGIFILST